MSSDVFSCRPVAICVEVELLPDMISPTYFIVIDRHIIVPTACYQSREAAIEVQRRLSEVLDRRVYLDGCNRWAKPPLDQSLNESCLVK
jgi:hypothetical protein